MQKYSQFQTSLIVFLILSLEIDFSIFGVPEEAKRLVLLIFMGIIGMLNFSESIQKNKKVLKQKHITFFLFYLAWVFISLAWSVSFSGSLSSVVGLLFGVIFVIGIFPKIEPAYLLKAIKSNSYIIFIASLLFLFVLPGYATAADDFFRLKGIMIHSQRLAILAGFIIILKVYEIKQQRNSLSDKILMVLAVTILFFVKTRAFSTFIILVVLFQVFANIPKKKVVFSVIVFSLIFMIFDFYSLLQNMYARGSQDVTDLTGRALVWVDTFSFIEANPILGYGFGSFKTGLISYSFWEPPHAHNLWLHITFETGIIGMILMNVVFFLFYRFVRKYKAISFAYYLLIYVVFISLTGIVIGYLITPFYIIFLLFVFIETERILSNG